MFIGMLNMSFVLETLDFKKRKPEGEEFLSLLRREGNSEP